MHVQVAIEGLAVISKLPLPRGLNLRAAIIIRRLITHERPNPQAVIMLSPVPYPLTHRIPVDVATDVY